MSEEIIITLEEPLMLDGATIRALRRRAGLTQAELGAKVGVSERSVRAWEKGEKRPVDPQRIRKLVLVLVPEKCVSFEPGTDISPPWKNGELPTAGIREHIERARELAQRVKDDPENMAKLKELFKEILGKLTMQEHWEQSAATFEETGILWHFHVDGTPVVWMVTRKRNGGGSAPT